MKILLVEDDEFLAQELGKALESQHYIVDIAHKGQTGWELAEGMQYDLILLDWMLPDLDGISLCKQIRQKGDRTPILLLTAQNTTSSKVTGLDAGADDYIVKPFDLYELLARVRALLRRGSSKSTPVLEWENLRLDPNKCEVTYCGQLLHLTPKEYALLELFLRNTNRIFSQSALLDHLWSFEEPPTENAVRAQIKSLRQKLKKAGAKADLIETVYGLGYRLKTTEPELGSRGDGEQGSRGAGERRFSGTQNSSVRTQNSSLKTQNSKLKTQNSPQIAMSPEVAGIWERFKEKYGDRITILEQAATALQAGSLSEQLLHLALKEAHTLMGSLGTFGFDEASRLCREIEQILKLEKTFSPAQVEHLCKLTIELRQVLGQRPAILKYIVPPPSTQQQPRLLIIDDDAELGELLIYEAKVWGMQAEVATDLTKATEALDLIRPDLVLLDLWFSDSPEIGFKFLAQLAAERPNLPVVVFTARDSFADRVRVARLGGRGFFQKPISPEEVLEAIALVLQQSSTPQAKLLIVGNDPQMLNFLRSLLQPWGFHLILLDDPHLFWTTLEKSAPDLLILDLETTGDETFTGKTGYIDEFSNYSGIDLCRVVRSDLHWSDLPIVVLSHRTDAQTLHRIFAAGADDCITEPILGPVLVARLLNRLQKRQFSRKSRKLIG